MTGLDCIAALKALGKETRLRILRLPFKEPLSVNEISARLNVSPYNISKDLRILRERILISLLSNFAQRFYGKILLRQTAQFGSIRSNARLLAMSDGC